MFDSTIRRTGSCACSRDVHRAAIAVLLLPAVFCAMSQAVEAAVEPAHPYLFFSAQDLPALRARMEREPFATRWRSFLAHAERAEPDAAFIKKGQREPAIGYRPQVARSGNGLIGYLHIPEGQVEWWGKEWIRARQERPAVESLILL